MPIYTFSVPARFIFDIEAKSEADAWAKAADAAQQANDSDNWTAVDVDVNFPRIAISPHARLALEEVATR